VLLHDGISYLSALFIGIAKISDFGFARVVTDMEQVDQFTLLGMIYLFDYYILGTPLYMAP
jgi:serine/threonine protein kinase